jgi:hypothetical protein
MNRLHAAISQKMVILKTTTSENLKFYKAYEVRAKFRKGFFLSLKLYRFLFHSSDYNKMCVG